MRERLRVLGAPGGPIDERIWAAFQNACEFSPFTELLRLNKNKSSILSPDHVPVNYTAWAVERDKVDPHSMTYSSQKDIGPLLNHIRREPSGDGKPPKRGDIQLTELKERNGCTFEADKGIPITLLITNTQGPPDGPFQVCLRAVTSHYLQANACTNLTRRKCAKPAPCSPMNTASTRQESSARNLLSQRGQGSLLARLITASGGQQANL
jgi:hypothetical protein